MTTTHTAPLTTPLTTPGPAVGRLALRQVWRGAAVVTVVAAATSGAVAATYDSVIADAPGGAQALSELAANPAIRTLFGEPIALDVAGGFTVWRVGTVLAVLFATWAALTTVRVLRGEEDTGRWDLLLAGRLPLAAAVTRHLAVLTGAALLAGTAVGGVLLVAGTDPTGALIHSAALGWIGTFFVAVGGLAAQLWPDRGSATGAAVTVVVIGLLARMVGDGVAALGWLRWLSPFGLIALARPYDANRVLPLLVLAAAALAVATGAVLAARRRDLRGGLLPDPRVRRSHPRLLGSVPAFAARCALRPTLAFALGIGAFYLLIGLIAESTTSFLQDNPAFADLARQAGFALDAVEGYAATLFALLTVPVAGYAASRTAALAHAEAARRLDLLLAAPLTRTRLLTAQAATTATGALTLTAAAALTAWSGTTISGVPLDLGAALAGAANTLPITALSLGAALLALGWAPRAVLAVGMLPAAGGFLLTVLADSIHAPAWIAALSPFDHLAPVPATAPDIPAALTMLAIAAGLAAAGLLGYHRRDIRHD